MHTTSSGVRDGGWSVQWPDYAPRAVIVRPDTATVRPAQPLRPSWRFLHLRFFMTRLGFFGSPRPGAHRAPYVTFSAPRPIYVTFFELSLGFIAGRCGDHSRIIIRAEAMLLFHKSAIWDFLRRILSAKIASLLRRRACPPSSADRPVPPHSLEEVDFQWEPTQRIER